MINVQIGITGMQSWNCWMFMVMANHGWHRSSVIHRLFWQKLQRGSSSYIPFSLNLKHSRSRLSSPLVIGACQVRDEVDCTNCKWSLDYWESFKDHWCTALEFSAVLRRTVIGCKFMPPKSCFGSTVSVEMVALANKFPWTKFRTLQVIYSPSYEMRWNVQVSLGRLITEKVSIIGVKG